MELSATLRQAQSPDLAARVAAEQQLQAWEQQSSVQLMVALATELANENADPNSRQLAGLHLKNLVTSRDADVALQKKQRWLAVEPGSRTWMKAVLLGVLRSSNQQAAHAGAQVVAKVGSMELADKLWPELLGELLRNMGASDVADANMLKTVTLEALGYMCEELEEEKMDDSETNQILTAIVDGLHENRPDSVRVAAANALLNSLVFTRHNFENEGERTMIMQVICGATKSTEPRLRVIAFESLSRVASLYYDKLGQYAQTIFQLTLAAIQSDADEQVAMMAIEFWSTLCDEEMEIMEELENDPLRSDLAAPAYAREAAPHVVPVLLNFALTKQDEAAEEDDWNVSAAGAICLGLVAQCVGDSIVPGVLQYVEANIMHPEWRLREASIMAFGQILEGPTSETLCAPVQTVLPVLLRALQDEHMLVKDTSAWTLARICELHASHIPEPYVAPLVTQLVAVLDDTSRVAAQACFAVHNLAQALEDDCAPDGSAARTNMLSPFFGPLLEKLVLATERPDWRDHNLRGQAYEAINMLIQTHAQDARHIVVQLAPLILQRLHATFSASIISQDDKEDRDNLQSLLCSVVQVMTRGVEKDILPLADHVVQLLLQVLANQNAVASEEAFMALGALASTCEAGFEKYVREVFPYLLNGLRSYNDWQVCSAAVGTTGDLCRALEMQILPCCDDVVTALLEDLQNPDLNRQVKPAVLSCFGDIALAIGGNFVKYLSVTLPMLEQAAATRVDENNEELVEYLNALREGILEAYIGIIQGLNEGNKASVLHPHLPAIFQFVEVIYSDGNRDEAVVKNAIGVVGDLADSLSSIAPEVTHFFKQAYIEALLDIDKDPNTSEAVCALCKWTRDKVKLLCTGK